MTKYDCNSSDGTVKMAIADQDINIIVYFDKRIAWFEAQRNYMVDFACALLKRAGVKFTLHPEPSVNFSGTIDKPVLNGLFRDQPGTPEGKYLVKRRDGTIPEWPSFVLGARDPCSPAALLAYAAKARQLGLNRAYANAVEGLAEKWNDYRFEHGNGDPDRGSHRKDDPATIAEMRKGQSV